MADSAAQKPSGFSKMKKVDDRVKLLIDEAAERKHRGLVLLVGDRGKDQIVNLHLMLSRANHNAKLNLLWCMKEDPDFGSTGKKQQERRARLEVKGGLSTEASKEAFQTFLSQTQIRFCKYKDTHKILGQTFGMAVLQDFEAMNPNTLARTIETVKGGGLVVIMFRSLQSLKQLHTIAMDVHARYRTEALQEVVPRFNERFLLSLTDCRTALCVDDDLNVLPITQHMKNFGSGRGSRDYDEDVALQGRQKHELDLMQLKEKLKPSAAVGPLVQLCQTMDQSKTVLSLMQTVAEKALDSTCVVTAGRGRGKSAALGMTAAGAIAQGYSNIFCTAPSPENLQTFFEFAVRGLKELGYKERVDFEAMQSTSEEFTKCVIRINVFREHRQTIQFIAATDVAKFAQAELAIIDEAAALPLTLVKQMLGPYLVILSSTISGYEGTGRSLSMKLVADMRARCNSSTVKSGDQRRLKEISMQDPIRYGPNDPVEKWLNQLLCLEATSASTPLKGCPHPQSCDLFYVNRDALFSYHPLAEDLLQRIQSLLAAAHYKNQPNDLQLLSDAPGHHLFVLCSSHVESSPAAADTLPDIYCVIHACEEGRVSSEAMKSNLSRGLRPSGDLIPYTLSQYYLEEQFAKLAGMRVVRIATNPELQRSGYGSRAMTQLWEYFSGSISLTAQDGMSERSTKTGASASAHDAEDPTALVKPRAQTPNLLCPLVERPYEVLDYLGVSYGLTTPLFNFWKRAGFEPLYIRQAANDLTGEHSCIMVRTREFPLHPLRSEFRRRLLPLMAMPFRRLPTEVALGLLADVEAHDAQKLSKATDASQSSKGIVRVAGVQQASYADILVNFTTSDLKRLQFFSTSFVEGGNVLDLIPRVATLYFENRVFRLPDGTEGAVLSHAQAAVLLAVGLQCMTLDELAQQTTFANVPVQQLRAFYQKGVAKIVAHLDQLRKLHEKQHGVALGGKRARRAGEEDIVEAEDEEAVVRYDAQGNVVGMSVTKTVKKKVDTDTTLMRSTSNVVAGGADKSVHKDLQNYFERPKKASKHK